MTRLATDEPKRYSVKGAWCDDTSITFGKMEMVSASDYDKLAEIAREAVELLRNCIGANGHYDAARHALLARVKGDET